MVGIWLAVHAPEQIDRPVLTCTSARFGQPEEWVTKANLVRTHGMAAVAHDALDVWFTPSFEGRGAKPPGQPNRHRSSSGSARW
jgi:hypothetical protein